METESGGLTDCYGVWVCVVLTFGYFVLYMFWMSIVRVAGGGSSMLTASYVRARKKGVRAFRILAS